MQTDEIPGPVDLEELGAAIGTAAIFGVPPYAVEVLRAAAEELRDLRGARRYYESHARALRESRDEAPYAPNTWGHVHPDIRAEFRRRAY